MVQSFHGNHEKEHSSLETILANSQTLQKSFLTRIADSYFAPKQFERWKNGRVYELLGVKYVQKVIMGTIGAWSRKKGGGEFACAYFIGRRVNLSSLNTYESGTRLNETIHAPLVLLCGYLTFSQLGTGEYVSATISGVATVVNVACTMLQRYNRARVYRVLEKQQHCPV